jgi:hypothetical protein
LERHLDDILEETILPFLFRIRADAASGKQACERLPAGRIGSLEHLAGTD